MAHSVNLLPWRQMRQRRCLRFWGLMLIGSALLMLLSVVVSQNSDRQSQALAQVRHRGSAACVAALVEREKARRVQQRHQARWQAQQDARRRTQRWQDRLLTLAAALPSQAWLTRLEASSDELRLEGRASRFSALAAMTAALRSLGFPTVTAGETGKDTQGQWQFSYRLSGEAHDVGSH